MRPRRTVPIVLAGDIAQRIDVLEREGERLADATPVQARRLSSRPNPRAAEIEAELASLREQAADRTAVVVIEALAGTPWGLLLGQHPPRTDVPDDKIFGVNEDTFADPAIRACAIGQMVDGELAPWEDDDLDWLLGFITDKQREKLIGAVIAVNRGDDAVPLSRQRSTIPTSDDE